jgi:hypothetical protein
MFFTAYLHLIQENILKVKKNERNGQITKKYIMM